MSNVVFHFVDPRTGRTRVDEFKVPHSLVGNEKPDTYHIFINVSWSASLLLDMTFDPLPDGHVVLLCAPQIESEDIPTFELFRDEIRRMCHDLPSPMVGGFRLLAEHDRMVAFMARGVYEIQNRVSERILTKSDEGVESVGELSSTVSDDARVVNSALSHPLWRRIWWIPGMDASWIVNVIGRVVDPAWLVIDEDDAKLCSGFKEFCGLGEDSPMPYYLVASPIMRFVSQQLIVYNENIIRAPRSFFGRYAIHCMLQRYHEDGDVMVAVRDGVFAGTSKLLRYVWLNWMQIIHPTFKIDMSRFFGDAKLAERICALNEG